MMGSGHHLQEGRYLKAASIRLFVRGSPRGSERPWVFTTSVRAASPFLAMDAPEKMGLIPGVLQHASPEVSEQHYNLARSVRAGQRFAANLADARSRLRLLARPSDRGEPPCG